MASVNGARFFLASWIILSGQEEQNLRISRPIRLDLVVLGEKVHCYRGEKGDIRFDHVDPKFESAAG